MHCCCGGCFDHSCINHIKVFVVVHTNRVVIGTHKRAPRHSIQQTSGAVYNNTRRFLNAPPRVPSLFKHVTLADVNTIQKLTDILNLDCAALMNGSSYKRCQALYKWTHSKSYIPDWLSASRSLPTKTISSFVFSDLVTLIPSGQAMTRVLFSPKKLRTSTVRPSGSTATLMGKWAYTNLILNSKPYISNIITTHDPQQKTTRKTAQPRTKYILLYIPW